MIINCDLISFSPRQWALWHNGLKCPLVFYIRVPGLVLAALLPRQLPASVPVKVIEASPFYPHGRALTTQMGDQQIWPKSDSCTNLGKEPLSGRSLPSSLPPCLPHFSWLSITLPSKQIVLKKKKKLICLQCEWHIHHSLRPLVHWLRSFFKCQLSVFGYLSILSYLSISSLLAPENLQGLPTAGSVRRNPEQQDLWYSAQTPHGGGSHCLGLGGRRASGHYNERQWWRRRRPVTHSAGDERISASIFVPCPCNYICCLDQINTLVFLFKVSVEVELKVKYQIFVWFGHF